MSQALIEALHDPGCYDHPVSAIEMVETHACWVLLTGDYAYKIRKPLDHGSFLALDDLVTRRALNEQEVELNRRLASVPHLEVVAISGSVTAPRVNDASAPFEYAVKLRQLSHRRLFGHLQASDGLSLEMLDDLVVRLASFHERAERAPRAVVTSDDALPARLRLDIDALGSRLEDAGERRRLAYLRAWCEEALARFAGELTRRGQEGYLRRSCGTLRLVDATREQRAVLLESVSRDTVSEWSDPGCDLAFLLVALEARGDNDFSHHVLNRYLELSGDHELVRLLALHQFHGALVRARVALDRHRSGVSDGAAALEEYSHCFALAEKYAEFNFPYLVIAVGVTGSGKSRFTGEMVRRLGNVRLRSDVERRRLFGDVSDVDAETVYAPDASERTYARLAYLTGMLLAAGRSVCIDATCLKRHQRDLLCHQAEGRGLPVLLISFEADEATLQERIEKRACRSGESAAAGLAVLAQQREEYEPFSEDERHHLIHLDTTAEDAHLTLIGLIQQHLPLR